MNNALLKKTQSEYPALAKKIKEGTVDILGAEGLNIMWAPPFVRLVQPQSDNTDPKEIGTIRHAETGELVRLKSVIPVGLLKTREWYDGKRKISVCRSRDGEIGSVYGKCASCKHKEFVEKADGTWSAPACVEVPILVVLDPTKDELYRVRLTVGNREEFRIFRKKVISEKKLNFGYIRLTPVVNQSSPNKSYKYDLAWSKEALKEEDQKKSDIAIAVVSAWRQAMLDKYAYSDEMDGESEGVIDTTTYTPEDVEVDTEVIDDDDFVKA